MHSAIMHTGPAAVYCARTEEGTTWASQVLPVMCCGFWWKGKYPMQQRSSPVYLRIKSRHPEVFIPSVHLFDVFLADLEFHSAEVLPQTRR